jgi:hypothetical protein
VLLTQVPLGFLERQHGEDVAIPGGVADAVTYGFL